MTPDEPPRDADWTDNLGVEVQTALAGWEQVGPCRWRRKMRQWPTPH